MDKNNIFAKNKVLICKKTPLITFGIKALIMPVGAKVNTKIPTILVNDDLPFDIGDIISINNSGNISCIWEINSPHNALYVTDVCNSRCIMCPQVENGVSRYDECLEILDYVKLNEH
ncbi:hypothetical protein II810_00370, partial [bacterium]|nr:hypothetical protein [bacterium]